MSKDATPVAESVEVTQADREAVADLLGGATPEGLLDGRQDTLSVVRAFARRRLAAYEAGRAEGVRVAAEVADRVADEWAEREGNSRPARAVADRLRALSKEPTK